MTQMGLHKGGDKQKWKRVTASVYAKVAGTGEYVTKVIHHQSDTESG